MSDDIVVYKENRQRLAFRPKESELELRGKSSTVDMANIAGLYIIYVDLHLNQPQYHNLFYRNRRFNNNI